MDRTISWLHAATPHDQLEIALREVEAGIGLVVAGMARTIEVCGLQAAQEAAFQGATRAQAAGVAFRTRRDVPGRADLVIGPLLAGGQRAHDKDDR